MKAAVGVLGMRTPVFLLIVAIVAGCKPQAHRAQTSVEAGATVALVVTPMFSLQSDWHRQLLIETPTGRLQSDLVQDTGWWRGSNLYRHSSGAYVLHEGQGGCLVFRVSPPELLRDPAVLCHKNDHAMNGSAAWVGTSPGEFPASQFYSDFRYIGQFLETPQGQDAISFISADEAPEPELPDIL